MSKAKKVKEVLNVMWFAGYQAATTLYGFEIRRRDAEIERLKKELGKIAGRPMSALAARNIARKTLAKVKKD